MGGWRDWIAQMKADERRAASDSWPMPVEDVVEGSSASVGNTTISATMNKRMKMTSDEPESEAIVAEGEAAPTPKAPGDMQPGDDDDDYTEGLKQKTPQIGGGTAAAASGSDRVELSQLTGAGGPGDPAAAGAAAPSAGSGLSRAGKGRAGGGGQKRSLQ